MDPAGGSRRSRAPAGARGGQGRRRGRGALARRRRPAGAGPRRVAGAGSPPQLRAARARAARRARRAAAAARGPRAERLRRDPRRGRSRAQAREPDLEAGSRGAWLGRAAGCVLGKPVENIPREGIRAIAQGTGNWPVRGWFTAEGLDPAVTERYPWNTREPPDEPRREHRRHPRGRRPQLHDARRRAARALRHATSTPLDVAKLWLDYLPPGRIFTAERVAMRNLLEAYLPPETATRRNPFREWIGARLRVDAYGWAAGGDPVARGADGVGGRARSATPRTASTRRCSWRPRTPRRSRATSPAECADVGARRSSRATAGSPRRCASRASSTAEWEDARRRALRALRRLPLGARDQQHRARRGRALRVRRDFSAGDLRASCRAAGTPTRTAPPSARSSARSGPIERALVGAAARPLRELAARLRRRSRSTSSPRARVARRS